VAQLAAGAHEFKGLSKEALHIKGIKLLSEVKKTKDLSWDELILQWDKTLTQLSDDFYHGIAQVDPKESQTCVWCALKPLCRINEGLTDER